MKNILIALAFLVSFVGNAQDLNEVREKFPMAQDNKEIAQNLNEKFEHEESSNSIINAYKGAVLTLMADFEKKKVEKLRLFKEGKKLIDDSIEASVDNIELRMIRLGVQENAPKILGYHKDMDKDKEFILRNYQATASNAEKEVVKKFALQSDSFSDQEKEVFN